MKKRINCVKILAGIMLGVMVFSVGNTLEVLATDTEEVITAQYTVTGSVSNLSFSGGKQVKAGDDYSATITNNGGCQLPSSISVTVGGLQILPGSSTYTYNARTGNIYIKSQAITGDIVISAAATAHQWTEDSVVIVGASCTQQGSQGKYCLVCGATSGTQGIGVTGHKFTNFKSNNDATCAKDGTKTGTCCNAGCTATSTVVDTGSRLSHTAAGSRVNVKPANCEEEGYTGDLHCKECNGIIRYGKVVPMSGHSEVLSGAQEPSCNIDGYTGDKICRYCSTVISKGEIIPALGEHTYGEWETVLQGTDLKAGRQERICSTCGMKESELITANKSSVILLNVGSVLLILLGLASVGFAIYCLVKKLKYVPAPAEEKAEEAAEAEPNDNVHGGIIVTEQPDTAEIF